MIVNRSGGVGGRAEAPTCSVGCYLGHIASEFHPVELNCVNPVDVELNCVTPVGVGELLLVVGTPCYAPTHALEPGAPLLEG